jgi:hypothetical protein
MVGGVFGREIRVEMFIVTVHPLLLFAISFVLLWLSARFGRKFGSRHLLDEQIRDDYGFVLTASLTLLGLIIGFSFSMATSRYDQRKNYEEGEANAIGTEYLRADLLPEADGAKVRTLLKSYLDERILFYETRGKPELKEIDVRTNQLQNQMWSAVVPVAAARPTPITALVVSGMNDVLNSQGYTQSAWWNRIPTAAWALMMAIAIGCNLLVGYSSRSSATGATLLFILPLVLSIAFMLVADIDSPRSGIIRISPQNLESLAGSLGQR